MTATPITAFALKADDGARPTAFRAVPENPRGAVQIAHGMAEHFVRYRPVVQALNAAGWAVYGQDHRGHGASAAVHGLGDFGPGGFEQVVRDMNSLSEVIDAELPGKPLVLLGHSMGSFAAQAYLPRFGARLSGLILSGTADVGALAEAMAQTAASGAFTPLNAPFEPARTPFDWLSRDEAQVDLYIADPLCGFELTAESRASVFGFAAGASRDAALADLSPDLPILVISGQFDPVTGPEQVFVKALLDAYAAAGLRHLEHGVYFGGRHEMFNETNRDEVIADLVAWLEAFD